MKIGLDVWSKYSNMLMFGRKTSIELPSEKSGLVPSEKYYKKVYGENGITPGLIANLAIGQGELLVTPLQMAQFAMILANNGEVQQPHLIYYLKDRVKNIKKTADIKSSEIKGIKPGVFELVRKGMNKVVSEGTGVPARIIGIDFAGKTGTAQNPHGDSHSWFICFAPYENPEIAMAVIVENGGSGSAVAAPIAGKFLRKYFYYQGKFDYEHELKILREIWARQQKLKEQAQLELQEQEVVEN
jgi:penicillin-binding protein 2